METICKQEPRWNVAPRTVCRARLKSKTFFSFLPQISRSHEINFNARALTAKILNHPWNGLLKIKILRFDVRVHSGVDFNSILWRWKYNRSLCHFECGAEWKPAFNRVLLTVYFTKKRVACIESYIIKKEIDNHELLNSGGSRGNVTSMEESVKVNN